MAPCSVPFGDTPNPWCADPLFDPVEGVGSRGDGAGSIKGERIPAVGRVPGALFQAGESPSLFQASGVLDVDDLAVPDVDDLKALSTVGMNGEGDDGLTADAGLHLDGRARVRVPSTQPVTLVFEDLTGLVGTVSVGVSFAQDAAGDAAPVDVGVEDGGEGVDVAGGHRVVGLTNGLQRRIAH